MKTAALLILLAAVILIGVLVKTPKLQQQKQRFFTGDKADTFDLHGCRVQATVVGSTEEDAWIEFLDSRGAWNARKVPQHDLLQATLHVSPTQP